MSEKDYRLVSELVRPGDHLDFPDDRNVVVEPSEHPGWVRVTYFKRVTRVPFEDDTEVAYVN